MSLALSGEDYCDAGIVSDQLSESSEGTVVSSQIEWISEIVKEFEGVKRCWEQHQKCSQTHPRWQSLHTEMHKQFRLIEVDLLFLRAARRTTTVEQRLVQMCDRLSRLIDYCDAGIKLSQQIDCSLDQDMLRCSEQS